MNADKPVRKFRISSVVVGLVFVAIAVAALTGEFDEASTYCRVVPVIIVIVGVAAIGSGLRQLIRRR